MKLIEINGVMTEMFSSFDISAIINRSVKTINDYDRYSEYLQSIGKMRLIPKPIRLGGCTYTDPKTGELVKTKGKRYWTKQQVEQIIKYSEHLKRGTMAKWHREIRKTWGKRGEEIQERRDRKRQELHEKRLEETLFDQKKQKEIERFKYLKKLAREKAGKTGPRINNSGGNADSRVEGIRFLP